MERNFKNTDSVIDSRDIIERKEWLEENVSILTDDESIELSTLIELNRIGEALTDEWGNGTTLIRHDYTPEYFDELVKDCYELPKGLPVFMKLVIDYEMLLQDYEEIEVDGVTYYVLSY